MEISESTIMGATPDPLLYRLAGVSKIYRKGRREIPAVRDLDLEITDGEWLAVRGKTGHGKTTLLQMLGGLDRPTGGRVEFAGADLAAAAEAQVRRVRARSFGFIFQTFNLVPTLSAAENVEAALIPLGTHASQRRARVVARPRDVGERRREDTRRRRQVAVAADEMITPARVAGDRLADPGERHARGEIGRKGVLHEDGARARVMPRVQLVPGVFALRAQHPFDVAGER